MRHETPGLPADWLNGWLAAIGVTVLVPGTRLCWTDDGVPSAVLETEQPVDLPKVVAEALPTCADCAYVPLCGADPIDHYARQGNSIGHRPTSDFCRKQMGLFDTLLRRWERGSPADRDILEGWALRATCREGALEAA